MTGREEGMIPENVRTGELLVAMDNGQLQPAPLLSQQVNMHQYTLFLLNICLSRLPPCKRTTIMAIIETVLVFA
jgi:hypothetical protein